MMDTNIQTVNHELRQLRWDWSNPRIVAYIQDLRRIKKYDYNPSNLPSEHYYKLSLFLRCYREINDKLVDSGFSWNDSLIVAFFYEHSERDKDGVITNRMKLIKWLELKNLVVNVIIPF